MEGSLQRQIYDPGIMPMPQTTALNEFLNEWQWGKTEQIVEKKSLIEKNRETKDVQALQHGPTIQPVTRTKRLSSRIAESIESSRSILELTDDWDEEGSPGYEESTWERSTQFVRNVALLFRQKSGVWINPPQILPGPEGSIDILWRTENRELLINIPISNAEPADYYGHGRGQDAIKGKLDLSLHNEWILSWLTR